MIHHYKDALREERKLQDDLERTVIAAVALKRTERENETVWSDGRRTWALFRVNEKKKNQAQRRGEARSSARKKKMQASAQYGEKTLDHRKECEGGGGGGTEGTSRAPAQLKEQKEGRPN